MQRKASAETCVLVFDSAILSTSVRDRVNAAVQAVEPRAYVVAGHPSSRRASWQAAYVMAPNGLLDAQRERIAHAAQSVKW